LPTPAPTQPPTLAPTLAPTESPTKKDEDFLTAKVGGTVNGLQIIVIIIALLVICGIVFAYWWVYVKDQPAKPESGSSAMEMAAKRAITTGAAGWSVKSVLPKDGEAAGVGSDSAMSPSGRTGAASPEGGMVVATGLIPTDLAQGGEAGAKKPVAYGDYIDEDDDDDDQKADEMTFAMSTPGGPAGAEIDLDESSSSAADDQKAEEMTMEMTTPGGPTQAEIDMDESSSEVSFDGPPPDVEKDIADAEAQADALVAEIAGDGRDRIMSAFDV
jgi:hypothetical protein